MLLLFGTVAHAQIIELEEAKVDFFPGIIEGADNTYSYLVKERTEGEFAKDALGFMKRNFDIHAFIDEVGKNRFDSYEITFQNGHGFLKAEFDDKGELKKTRQEFKDVLVPADIRTELYRNHKGWTMVKNKYYAKGRGELIEKELYKIKLENGKQSKNITINPRARGAAGVVSR